MEYGSARDIIGKAVLTIEDSLDLDFKPLSFARHLGSNLLQRGESYLLDSK